MIKVMIPKKLDKKQITEFLEFMVKDLDRNIRYCQEGIINYNDDIDQLTAFENKIRYYENTKNYILKYF